MIEFIGAIAPLIALVVYAIVMACIIEKKTHGDAFVKVDEDGSAHVRGDPHTVARMMVACVLSLEEEGYDMTQVKSAIKNVQRKDEGAEDD